MDDRRPGRRGAPNAAVALLCLAQFVDVLGVTVVVTALPSLLRDVRAPVSATAPVVTGYAMFFGGLLLLGARLGDRWGHRRVLQAGLALFAVGSSVAATATTVVALVAARCVQGAAAAASVPAALRLLSAVATDEVARRRALAAWSATGAAAGASGFVVGGVLTEYAGWRLVFWVNVPLAVLLAAGVRRAVPHQPGDRSARPDVAGAALLTGSVMALVAGAALAQQPAGLAGGAALLAAGVGLFAAFWGVEKRIASPLLPRAAVGDARLRRGTVASFLNTATTSSPIALATLYLQRDLGVGPAAAGAALLPFSLCAVAGSAASARLLRRRAPVAVIAIGLAVIAAGDAGLLALPAGPWVLPVAVAVGGTGIGLSSVAATALGTSVPAALQGAAAGILNTAAQLGTALGVAGVLVVALALGDPAGWALAVALAAAGAVASGVGGDDRRRRPDSGQPSHQSARGDRPPAGSTRLDWSGGHRTATGDRRVTR